ncbi:MAG: transposase [Caldilineaceae bacterium]|nr:transposase [Caldilineaceae bacterium]
MTSIDVEGLKADIERVDDIPLIYGLLNRVGIQAIVDQAIPRHGNWQGLSPGWVITIWLLYILNEKNHLMEPVQSWTRTHMMLLRRLTGQAVEELDMTDDRLALCLHYLHQQATWVAIEKELGIKTIRIYGLSAERIRLDATVGTVSHDPFKHTLFKVGKAKNGLYETQFKLMLASLDPLGLPLVSDVEPGHRADDPLYVPSYQRAKEILDQEGVLVVGDSKMSALKTLATMVAGKDHYLTPLTEQQEEKAQLDQLLADWQEREEEATRVFLPQEMPIEGEMPDPDLAIAYGFESERERSVWHGGKQVTWTERLLVVRSDSYVQTMQDGLHRRLDKAEEALRNLTPPRQPGRRQIEEEATLLAAIERIEKKYRVRSLFDLDYQREVEERHVRAYRGKPARVERKVRYQLSVARNAEAIAAAEFRAGWRLYVTNAPKEKLSFSNAVLAYRDQIVAENIFRRLHGKFLGLTPLYVQRDDHAKGLVHLLTIGARILALGDYLAKEALAQEESELSGIYLGNAKRATATPTMERMLNAFENINLLIFPVQPEPLSYLTELSPVQKRILTLLGLTESLYTDLQSA